MNPVTTTISMQISNSLKSLARKFPVIGPVLIDRDQLRRKINQLDAQALEASNFTKKCLTTIQQALNVPLPVPAGLTEEELYNFVTSVRVSDAPEEEMRNYGSHDFRRFVYTLGMTKDLKGKCLELGANPYFTTVLLKEFTDLELTLANYFGDHIQGPQSQDVLFKPLDGSGHQTLTFPYVHFNIEQDLFPFPDQSFDVVIFAEIIEHLLMDPCKVIREIKRILKPAGTLLLTTPNVARLENVSKLISGTNIYDPYSGYGPYGRHNREFNVHELVTLLRYEGFDVSDHFTADVHHNAASQYSSSDLIATQLIQRKNDLGQYIFVKSVNSDRAASKRPSWLYRSLPQDRLEQVAL